MASGEDAVLRRRHAAFYVVLAEEAEPGLLGPQQVQWLARLESEHDNLRAALDWALESNAVEVGLRIAAALWRFWYAHGHLSEGREWLEKLLAQAGHGGTDTTAPVQAKALIWASWLAIG
jgi:non-specific serine/threonine protein kinase